MVAKVPPRFKFQVSQHHAEQPHDPNHARFVRKLDNEAREIDLSLQPSIEDQLLHPAGTRGSPAPIDREPRRSRSITRCDDDDPVEAPRLEVFGPDQALDHPVAQFEVDFAGRGHLQQGQVIGAAHGWTDEVIAFVGWAHAFNYYNTYDALTTIWQRIGLGNAPKQRPAKAAAEFLYSQLVPFVAAGRLQWTNFECLQDRLGADMDAWEQGFFDHLTLLVGGDR